MFVYVARFALSLEAALADRTALLTSVIRYAFVIIPFSVVLGIAAQQAPVSAQPAAYTCVPQPGSFICATASLDTTQVEDIRSHLEVIIGDGDVSPKVFKCLTDLGPEHIPSDSHVGPDGFSPAKNIRVATEAQLTACELASGE